MSAKAFHSKNPITGKHVFGYKITKADGTPCITLSQKETPGADAVTLSVRQLKNLAKSLESGAAPEPATARARKSTYVAPEAIARIKAKGIKPASKAAIRTKPLRKVRP